MSKPNLGETESPEQNAKAILILRLLLLAAAFGWGISVIAVFAPWSVIVDQCAGLGARELPDDAMLQYWLRMAAGAFSAIGIFFIVLALNPRTHSNFVVLGGLFMVGEGLVLLMHGLLLKLDPLPYYVDVLFCLVIGSGILITWRVALCQKLR